MATKNPVFSQRSVAQIVTLRGAKRGSAGVPVIRVGTDRATYHTHLILDRIRGPALSFVRSSTGVVTYSNQIVKAQCFLKNLTIIFAFTCVSFSMKSGLLCPCPSNVFQCLYTRPSSDFHAVLPLLVFHYWAEARLKIARMTLTIKRDGNYAMQSRMCLE